MRVPLIRSLTVIESQTWSRGCSPETTLQHAQQLMSRAGITEVREITGTDSFGVSVFVSVRPAALGESQTFGKGLRPIDAQIGAIMEGIEYYFTEPGVGCVQTRWGTARDVIGSSERDDAILDFVPMIHREADLDAPLLLASATDLENGNQACIPAELVFCPAPLVGQSLFGASTNGLASGNSLVDATIQSLLELLERDIWSFESIRASSLLVDKSTLPASIQQIIEIASKRGLTLKIRTIPNEYGMPFFVAFVFDDDNPTRSTFNGGWACDLNRERCLIRAVTEAAQSRVAFLDGGRKIPKSHQPVDSHQEAKLVRQHIRGVSDPRGQVKLSDIPHLTVQDSLDRQLAVVIACLRRVIESPIYRVVYTPPEAEVQVVRCVVPLLENLKETRIRVGRRLKAAIDSAVVHAG